MAGSVERPGSNSPGALVGAQGVAAVPRCRARRARPHPRRDRDRRRTLPRPARRRSAPCRSRRAAAGRAPDLRSGSGGNRSAECRQRRRPSTPRARRLRQRRARVDRADAAVREIRAHDAHVQVAAETKYRRQSGRVRSAAGGPRAACTDWPTNFSFGFASSGAIGLPDLAGFSVRLSGASARPPRVPPSRCSDSRCSGTDWTRARRRGRRR